jgi:hypothetical protein
VAAVWSAVDLQAGFAHRGACLLRQDLSTDCAGKGERDCQPDDAAEAEDECLGYCVLDARIIRLDCGESRALRFNRLSFGCGKDELIKPAAQVVLEDCKQHQPKDRNGEQAGKAGNCVVDSRGDS